MNNFSFKHTSEMCRIVQIGSISPLSKFSDLFIWVNFSNFKMKKDQITNCFNIESVTLIYFCPEL